MTNEELEELKAEVEKKLSDLKDLVDGTETELIQKIDKIYENELYKTLAAINQRLTVIERKLDEKETMAVNMVTDE